MPALPDWYTRHMDIVNLICFQCLLAMVKKLGRVRKETALLQKLGSLKVLEDD